ncbi:ankyrin repeat domain-containing protein 6 isoform X2 [Hippoglossus stenolepis]|uniref:ankyrin repeat domain-containing protein 6 isoform X2 n=1 Tax=Hippoglossus stenolepis TaxID=195615 RepID=UPI001FAFCDAF|nr:ankyrin repeat domain-containing protein 6 isoform X2 [Hippoglossus stenolepis]
MNDQALVHVPTSSCQGPGHQTALHQAAMVGNSDAMTALIQGGCALDLQNRDGNTALHEVSWHGFSQCVKLLVKAGADVHIMNKAGNTALHLACQNAHAQTARVLLLGGSNPDTKNNVGDSCMHVAARYNNLNLVKILLNSLCSVTERNQGGETALHVAAALNHKKTVQLLLEAGTDGNIRNNAGKTALDKARDNNHKELAILLARAPQVHRFMRGRTIRKRRERLISERRSQSVTRVEILPNKSVCPEEDSCSVVEECPNSEQMQSRTAAELQPQRRQQQQTQNQKTPATIDNAHSHCRRRDRKQTLDEDDPRNGKTDFHNKRDLLCDDGFKQLFTRYRDEDGNIIQAPANGCHCKPLLKKLEGQMKATQEEMMLHILNVQECVSSRMGKMDQRNRHQIKVLNVLNEERAAAERKNMIYRMERRAAQDREEALKTQAAVSQELKMWWMSHLNDMDAQIPTNSQYYKLLPSPSVEQSEADADLESLPLLSVVSGDSSTSLANYVNILPTKSGLGDLEQVGRRTYFEMRLKRSPDDYENTALFPPPSNHIRDIPLGSADPIWQHSGVQDSPVAAVVPLCGGGFSSSGSQSSISEQGTGLIPHQERRHDRQHMKHFGELMSSCRQEKMHNESTTTLECFIKPTEPSFNQERNYLHAMEVTQRFFDTVSTQLERWYERKLVEVEQQIELRAQQDRKELMQRISTLEEELQRLNTNENADI